MNIGFGVLPPTGLDLAYYVIPDYLEVSKFKTFRIKYSDWHPGLANLFYLLCYRPTVSGLR